MNRDDVPAGAVIALATGELMVTARRLTARLPRLQRVSTEPGRRRGRRGARGRRRDLAEDPARSGPRRDGDGCGDGLRGRGNHRARADYRDAPRPAGRRRGILALTAEWRAETYPGDRRAGVPMGPGVAMPPPLALASSVAFDRAEDRETRSSVPVLLTLAHLAIPGRVSLSDAEADWLAGHQGADGYYREDDEPEPEEYDPGPECGDAGGMSEYRHAWPEEGR